LKAHIPVMKILMGQNGSDVQKFKI